MIQRCTNPNVRNWHRYGGRGITVVPRWLVFENFLADMGEKPEGLTLERKDNDGNYEPSNCRWATPMEQANNRRSSRFVTINGRRMTIAQAVRLTGESREALTKRSQRQEKAPGAGTERV